MCTVTFVARKNGYALGMNRDEKLSRIKGWPPKLHSVAGRKVLSPSEPSGGTWISLNDEGVTFALINWYAITTSVKANPISRGDVVNAVCAARLPNNASEILETLTLARMNPFRLIGIFPTTHEVIQWQWNLQKLVVKKHRWQTQQWISSGFDEPTAQRIRSSTFRRSLKQKSAGTLDWLGRLHRSHKPESGPFATCMHRADAETVSYTEVSVSLPNYNMRHHLGSPCRGIREERR